MNLSPVEKIGEAVLYEGYMLYPYRPSSVKNRQRWNFGVLYPPSWSAQQQGTDPYSMQTECLLRATPSTRLVIKIRFLQLVGRSIGKLLDSTETPADQKPAFEPVERLEVDGRVYRPWQEAMEREVTCASFDPHSSAQTSLPFRLDSGDTWEYLRDAHGNPAGIIARSWETLQGSIQIHSNTCRDDVLKISVQVHNSTAIATTDPTSREAVLSYSLLSAHTILGAEDGEFLSLLEPPPGCEDLAAGCRNIGTWPVLAGNGPATMLSSPIILYDYPQIAPESAGNLFDSTEIDEILSLRILTLTDDEKREMRQSDDRTRGILERTENMPEEQFMKLHGIMRGLTPISGETL